MSAHEHHEVLGHLGLQARDYDQAIRTYVPWYDEMIATVVKWVRENVRDDARVVDLGTGTGALAFAILNAMPNARVELVDLDPAMLEVAAMRIAPFSARASVRHGSFLDPIEKCDAVVASLSLHHVADRNVKREMYQRIHNSIVPGGVMVIADATVHSRGSERRGIFREWSAWMRDHGIGAQQAEALFTQWAGEDYYVPIVEELSLVTAAGFAHADCFWKRGPTTVYGGCRE